jgi:hypothetical protein
VNLLELHQSKPCDQAQHHYQHQDHPFRHWFLLKSTDQATDASLAQGSPQVAK